LIFEQRDFTALGMVAGKHDDHGCLEENEAQLFAFLDPHLSQWGDGVVDGRQLGGEACPGQSGKDEEAPRFDQSMGRRLACGIKEVC